MNATYLHQVVSRLGAASFPFYQLPLQNVRLRHPALGFVLSPKSTKLCLLELSWKAQQEIGGSLFY